VIAAVALLTSGKVMAGGAYGFNWDNDGVTVSGTPNGFYSDAAGTVPLPVGDLVQLIAVSGGSNFVLAATTIGQNPDALASSGSPQAGFFDLSSGTSVYSNQLQQVIGDPVGVAVWNAQQTAEVTIWSTSVTSPSPDWSAPPSSAIVVEPDAQAPGDGNWPTAWNVSLNSGLAAGVTANGMGYYLTASVPEPSSIALVVMGLLGGFGLIRRRRS
jgi:hypothetical protein